MESRERERAAAGREGPGPAHVPPGREGGGLEARQGAGAPAGRELWPTVAAATTMGLYLTTPACWGFTLYLLWHDAYLRLPILLYILYIFGPGRKAAAALTWTPHMRRWGIWKNLARYFPVRLVKTAKLPPHNKYIFGLHPHGVMTLSAWASFASDGAGFSRLYPGIDLHPGTLKWNFITPIARELMLLLGFIDVDAASLLQVLREPGRGVLLAIGGADEALLARPGANDIILRKRKGFVRIALQTGASLVPIFSFGENDVVEVVDTTKVPAARRFQALTKRLLGFVVPVVYGEGLFGLPFGLLPHRVPVTTVIGAPIQVPKWEGDLRSAEGRALVDRYHALYVAALQRLFEAHKPQYAPQAADLRIVK